jgi:hypothetical protein
MPIPIARLRAIRPRALPAQAEELGAISLNAKADAARDVSQDVGRQFDGHIMQCTAVVANQVVMTLDDGVVSSRLVGKVDSRNHSFSLEPVQRIVNRRICHARPTLPYSSKHFRRCRVRIRSAEHFQHYASVVSQPSCYSHRISSIWVSPRW